LILVAAAAVLFCVRLFVRSFHPKAINEQFQPLSQRVTLLRSACSSKNDKTGQYDVMYYYTAGELLFV